MNAIANNPVTIDDINLAEKIYGTDIGNLKGKTTRTKPKPVVKDYIEIPKALMDAQKEVELAIDGMKVEGIPFLTSISTNIKYRTAQPLNGTTAQDYRSAIDTIF
jgi:hypothetical protein